jgi:hypothetical protein
LRADEFIFPVPDVLKSSLREAAALDPSPMYARKVRTFSSPGKNRTDEEDRYSPGKKTD